MTKAEEKMLSGENELKNPSSAEGMDFKISAEDMAEAGLHFGHQTSKTNPKMKQYIFGARNSIHIIDLEQTAEKLKEALKFIADIVSKGGILLFVGTKIQIKDLVKNTAIECGMPYISERWLGGTFTNFGTLSKRIEYFRELEKKRAGGELDKYTKKERSDFDKKINKLEMKFGGTKELAKLPDAIFICDMKKDEIALKEAKKKGIKVIGIAHTNVDPTLADYPVPANDDAIPSIKYILEKVKDVILKVKSK